MCIFIIVLVVIIVICDGIIGVSVILLLLSMFSVLYNHVSIVVIIFGFRGMLDYVLIVRMLEELLV